MPGRRSVSAASDHPSRVDYRTLSDFRYQVRRFLRIRELAAYRAGIEPQQYLLLLHIKGLDGQTPATVGALAERMQLQQHGVVQLIDRLGKRGMVRRRRGSDRRQVVITLTARGESVLRRLVRHSVAELKTEGPLLVASLKRLVWKAAARGRAQPGGASMKRSKGRLAAMVVVAGLSASAAVAHGQMQHGAMKKDAGGTERAAPPAPIRTTMTALHAQGGVPRGWTFRVPPGDVTEGRKVFASMECFACHEIKEIGRASCRERV